MRTFLQDFHERRTQVKRYISLVVSADREASRRPAGIIETERVNVLRAGSFLILYNLIEASARDGIQAIHDEIQTNSIDFTALNLGLRREVIKSFKRRADPDEHAAMMDLPVDLVRASLDVEYHFSGNVDARLLRQIGERYGFSISSDGSTRQGADLVTIKGARNDLAHGQKTYDQVGRDWPARNLLGVALRSVQFMEDYLQSIDAYIEVKAYLAPPAVAAAAPADDIVT